MRISRYAVICYRCGEAERVYNRLTVAAFAYGRDTYEICLCDECYGPALVEIAAGETNMWYARKPEDPNNPGQVVKP